MVMQKQEKWLGLFLESEKTSACRLMLVCSNFKIIKSQIDVNFWRKTCQSCISKYRILLYPLQTHVIIALEQNPKLKIGEVARQLDIAVETIRMYEREGLLLVHKTETGQRLFSASDVHWISCIRRLITERGLNLEGIRRMLAFLPCWELKPCSEAERENCPAYLNAMKPCWMIKSQLASNCQTLDCRGCKVYHSARHCDNLKELLRRHDAQSRQ